MIPQRPPKDAGRPHVLLRKSVPGQRSSSNAAERNGESLDTKSLVSLVMLTMIFLYIWTQSYAENWRLQNQVQMLQGELDKAYSNVELLNHLVRQKTTEADDLQEQSTKVQATNRYTQKRVVSLKQEINEYRAQASILLEAAHSARPQDPSGEKSVTSSDQGEVVADLQKQLATEKALFGELERSERSCRTALESATASIHAEEVKKEKQVERSKEVEQQEEHVRPAKKESPVVESLPGAVPGDLIKRAAQRRNRVKEAFKHAWSGYERYAFGTDELRPTSMTGHNWLGQGGTIVDSLDTMWIMGLEDEFHRGRKWVESSLHFEQEKDVSFFETTIRVVGGLLSAYELSDMKHPGLLAKAKEVGDKLMYAFNTDTGIPMSSVNMRTHHVSTPKWTGGAACLAEIGSVQLEFSVLSRHTKNPEYAQKAINVYRILDSMEKSDGLYPLFVDHRRKRFTVQHVSLGAMGDSFYEYLLKLHLLSGKKRKDWKRMYDESMLGVFNNLIMSSRPSDLLYLAERKNGRVIHKMDHLACFAAGMLALGARGKSKTSVEMRVAEGLARTCYEMYARMPSKLAPENVQFREGQDFTPGARYNLQRPETVESLFILWRMTKEQKYRDMGWAIFEAFEKHTRVESGGYSGLRDVSQEYPTKDDTMQTFWLAETLKYFYLLFSDDDLISLDEYVFNTEAHPLRVFDFDEINQ